MTEENLTPEEIEMLEQLGLGYPKEEEKQSIFSFFKRVITMPETTRTSNLKEEEMGMAKIPLRTYLELSLFCKETGLTGLGNYFKKEGSIVTDPTLSREGFLDKLVVTQKKLSEIKAREFTDKQKRSWFKKKEEVGGNEI